MKDAGVPLNETAVVPVNPCPRISTRPPARRAAGRNATNGASPDRLQTSPSNEKPPKRVVPYKVPLVACISADQGYVPAEHSRQKLASVVRTPVGVILKAVPCA